MTTKSEKRCIYCGAHMRKKASHCSKCKKPQAMQLTLFMVGLLCTLSWYLGDTSALLGLAPLVIAAGISAGSAIAGGFANRSSQKRQNARDRQFQLNMYNRQREDNLADFKMANEYNSPKQQMERMREAGLNPMLMYTGGGSVAQASPIKEAQPSGGNQPAPRYDELGTMPQIFMDFINMQKSQAMTNQIEAQTEYIKTRDELAQVGIRRGTVEADIIEASAEARANAPQLRNQKMLADTAFTLDSNQRAELIRLQNQKASDQQIAESIQRIISNKVSVMKMYSDMETNVYRREQMQSAINLLNSKLFEQDAKNRIAAKAAELAEQGVDPKSPWWLRSMILGGADISPETRQSLDDILTMMSPQYGVPQRIVK